VFKLLIGKPSTLNNLQKYTHFARLLNISQQPRQTLEPTVTMDVVNVLIQDKPVVIFSKSSCCMSHSVETLIRGFGANPTVYDLDRIPNGQQIERALMQLGFRQSVPAVFIGQQLVGNERNVMSLHIQNQLVPLLIQAGAIWI